MEDTLMEIANIMSNFDLNEIEDLIGDQIVNDETSENLDTPIDHFKPFYLEYKNYMSDDTLEEETKNELEVRFNKICDIFIRALESKYIFNLNKDYINDNYADHKAITFALYSFFVLDFRSILTSFIINFINENYELIYSSFEDKMTNKDASSIAYKKEFSQEYNLIIANLYSISEWSIDSVEGNDQFLEYIDKNYAFYGVIKKLIEDGALSIDLSYTFSKIYKTSTTLRSNVVFDCIASIKGSKIDSTNEE
jgi:hypothetical protein